MPKQAPKGVLTSLLLAGALLLQACTVEVDTAAETETRIAPKVIVVTMFEVGDVRGDEVGELQFWVERLGLDTEIDFAAGFERLFMNDDGVMAILVGGGHARQTIDLISAQQDRQFDSGLGFQPPILMIPDVLSRADCEQLIELYDTHDVALIDSGLAYDLPIFREAAEAYPERLRSLLAERHGAWEVVNAGVPGWVSTDSLINFQLRVLPLDPDVVVVYQGRNEVLPQAYNNFVDDYTHYRRPGFSYAVSNFGHKWLFSWSRLCMLLCTARGQRFGWSETIAAMWSLSNRARSSASFASAQ